MEPTQELVDALYREELEAARRMPFAEKLLEGPRLFDRSRRLMLAGLRAEHPGASEDELHALLIERLERLERLERHRDE